MGKRLIFSEIAKKLPKGKGSDAQPPVQNPEAAVPEVDLGAHAMDGPRSHEREGLATIADAIIASLGEGAMTFADQTFKERLKQYLVRIFMRGWNHDGPRRFQTYAHKRLFKRIDLNLHDTLRKRYKAGYQIAPNLNRSGARAIVDPFDPREYLRKPRHATHFRIFLVAAALSDMVYSETAGTYVPVEQEFHDRHIMVYSDTYPIDAPVADPITLIALLPSTPPLPETAGLLVSFGIEFLHQGKGKAFPRTEMRAMEIVGLF